MSTAVGIIALAVGIALVVSAADVFVDGLLGAVKFLRGGKPAWPQADEDARAADSPGRGHRLSERGRLIARALDEAGSTLRSKAREELRQQIVAALVEDGAFPAELEARLRQLAEDHERTLEPVEALARTAREEAGGVLVVRADKDLGRSVKKALLSLLEERAPVAVVVEGQAITVDT